MCQCNFIYKNGLRGRVWSPPSLPTSALSGSQVLTCHKHPGKQQYHFPHFPDEKTKAPRGSMMNPRSPATRRWSPSLEGERGEAGPPNPVETGQARGQGLPQQKRGPGQAFVHPTELRGQRSKSRPLPGSKTPVPRNETELCAEEKLPRKTPSRNVHVVLGCGALLPLQGGLCWWTWGCSHLAPPTPNQEQRVRPGTSAWVPNSTSVPLPRPHGEPQPLPPRSWVSQGSWRPKVDSDTAPEPQKYARYLLWETSPLPPRTEKGDKQNTHGGCGGHDALKW